MSRRAPLDLWSRTAAISLARGTSTVAQLIATIVLVRALEPAAWSTFSFFLSIYLPAVSVGGLNLHQGILYFFGRVSRGARRTVVAQTLVMLGASGALVAAAVVALVPILGTNTFGAEDLLPFLALIVLLETPTVSCQQILLGVERPTLAAVFDGGMAVLQALSLVGPAILGLGARGMTLGLLGYACVRLILFALLLRRVLPPGIVVWDRQLFRDQWSYSLPLGLTVASVAINRSVGKWLVAALDPESFGSYAIAAQELPLASVLPYSVSAVLSTRMVFAFRVGDVPRVRAYWLALTSRMSLVMLPLTLGAMLCGRELLGLIAPGYLGALLPFQVHTLILVHRVAEYGIILRASGRTRELWWASFVLLASNACLSAPLVWAFGALGAAIGAFGAAIVSWVFVLWRIRYALDTPWSRVFPFKVYLSSLCLSTTAALVVSGLATVLHPEGEMTVLGPGALGLRLAVKVVAFAALVISALHVLRLVKQLHPVPAEDDSFHAEYGSPLPNPSKPPKGPLP